MDTEESNQAEWVRAAVDRYARPLNRYAALITGDLEQARDVVQDTFVRLCAEESGRVNSHLAQWLFTVCRNRALDVQRKESRMKPLSEVEMNSQASSDPSPAEHAEQRDTASELLGLLAQLPKNQQEVVRLKFQNGLSYQEISQITKLTVSNVELHIPGTDIFDPDKDPARNNPPGTMSRGLIAGTVFSGFVFDAKLDDALFRLDPPADYAVEPSPNSSRYNVTEKEMIDFLGILADYNDQTFPEKQELAGVFSDGRHTKTMEKRKEDRTATEQKFVETTGHYIEANQNDRPIGLNDPVGYFLNHSTVENSFRYLGKGVKLGDKDRLVCWYKLRGGTTYRVVFGDLSVRDVPPEDLPLPVEP